MNKILEFLSEFLGCHGELVREAYLCDLHHTAAPKVVLQSPGHVTVTDFNDKQTNLLAAGAEGRGLVFTLCILMPL